MGTFAMKQIFPLYSQVNTQFSWCYVNICVTKQILPLSTNKHKVQLILWEYLPQNKYYHYIHKWIKSSADVMWIFVSQNKILPLFPQINIKFSSFYGNTCVTKKILQSYPQVNTKFGWCYVNICVTKQILPLYPQVNTKFIWCYEHIYCYTQKWKSQYGYTAA